VAQLVHALRYTLEGRGVAGVAGSVSDGVTGTFHLHNPFVRTTVLGSTQPLKEMSSRNIPWVGGEGGNLASV
jgi:hypothetical protein